jgi:hypothetical protein
MESLRVRPRSWFDLLDKKTAEFMLLGALADSGQFVREHADDSAALDHDKFAVVLGYHLVLMGEMMLELFLEGRSKDRGSK